MKKAIILIIPLLFAINSFSQNWIEPVNVSNMDGKDSQPDITVDQNGIIHCVWVHKINSNYWKVYYSKSDDEGFIWSIPEDISLNEEKWISNPHIISDTKNNLYVSYDYDVGNPAETMVYFKTFNGIEWSEPIIISENMPSSYQNRTTIDKSNRIYVFWYNTGINGFFYYRYFENSNWSNIICPYNYHMVVAKAIPDINKDVHCLAGHHGGQTYNNKYVYFKYNYENNLWSDTTEISKLTSSSGEDIDLYNNNHPHFTWRQRTPMTGSLNDSTMYRYFDGISWSTPELIVEDPFEQQIAMDENNQPNIFDVEKTEEGSMLVHYFKTQNIWEGYIIDESDWYGMFPEVLNNNHCLLAVYSKPLININSEIFFSKSDIINFIDEVQKNTLKFNIYPNPFHQHVKITFELNNSERILIKIFSIHGKLKNTLINENKTKGEYEIIWNGKDLNGKEVNSGLYLVRLQSGRNILTRSVEYIK